MVWLHCFYTHLNLALLLHKTVLATFLLASTVSLSLVNGSNKLSLEGTQVVVCIIAHLKEVPTQQVPSINHFWYLGFFKTSILILPFIFMDSNIPENSLEMQSTK